MSLKGLLFERPAFILLAAGIGCFVLSFVAMGISPWTTLANVTSTAKSQLNPYYDADGKLSSSGRGREIYIREGCWHCHSQFVRPVAGEPFRYGPASEAWESMFDIPQTYGTRRIGPDLSREAGRRPNDWHLAHLYNPRSVVPLSVMPSYPQYFEMLDGKIGPKQEARDLVTYLQGLGKAYEKEIRDIVYPAHYKVSGSPVVDQASIARGTQLFAEHCSGCHGKAGDGGGIAGQFLSPKPADLVNRFVSASEAYDIVNRGVLGSSMPSFREMPERDLWALGLFASQLGAHNKNAVKAIKSDDPTVRSKVERGKGLFAAQCAVCHGAQGRGDGPTAGALNPRPKDFSRRVFGKDAFFGILENGVPGSVMPPFKGFSTEEREELYHFVLSLYDEAL